MFKVLLVAYVCSHIGILLTFPVTLLQTLKNKIVKNWDFVW